MGTFLAVITAVVVVCVLFVENRRRSREAAGLWMVENGWARRPLKPLRAAACDCGCWRWVKIEEHAGKCKLRCARCSCVRLVDAVNASEVGRA